MDKKTTLVLSSGGTKGVAFLGALEYITKYTAFNISQINTFVGTSAGALIGLMLSIGYSVEELKGVIVQSNIQQFFKDIKIINFVNNMGLIDTAYLRNKISELLESKGYKNDITLGNLYNITKKEIIFVSTDIISEKIVYISHSAFPGIKVIDAVLSSMSIPLIFPPVKVSGMCLVDGALLEPVCLDKNVIGYDSIILDIKSQKIESVNSIQEFILKLVNTSVNNNKKKIFYDYYFEINTTNNNILDTKINKEKIDKMFLEGSESIKKKLKLKKE